MESDESWSNEIAESHVFFSIAMLGIIPHLHYFCPFGVIVVGFLIQISAHVFSCFMVSYCNVAIWISNNLLPSFIRMYRQSSSKNHFELHSLLNHHQSAIDINRNRFPRLQLSFVMTYVSQESLFQRFSKEWSYSLTPPDTYIDFKMHHGFPNGPIGFEWPVCRKVLIMPIELRPVVVG